MISLCRLSKSPPKDHLNLLKTYLPHLARINIRELLITNGYDVEYRCNTLGWSNRWSGTQQPCLSFQVPLNGFALNLVTFYDLFYCLLLMLYVLDLEKAFILSNIKRWYELMLSCFFDGIPKFFPWSDRLYTNFFSLFNVLLSVLDMVFFCY